MTAVDSEGRFVVPLTIPDDENLPSGTRLEAQFFFHVVDHLEVLYKPPWTKLLNPLHSK